MKILTNKNAIRASNNQVVFYKNQVCCIKLSLKMKSGTRKKDSEQLFYRAPLDGYFTNINTKFTSSFIRTQTLPKITPYDNTKINK